MFGAKSELCRGNDRSSVLAEQIAQRSKRLFVTLSRSWSPRLLPIVRTVIDHSEYHPSLLSSPSVGFREVIAREKIHLVENVMIDTLVRLLPVSTGKKCLPQHYALVRL